MAQTLAALPAVSSPVKVTDAKTLAGNIAAIQNLSNREVIALSIIAKIIELAHNGGTNYQAAGVGHKQLRTDATTFMGAFGLENFPPGGTYISRMRAVIDWNAGYAADSALGTDVNALVVTMAGLRETPESTLCLFLNFLLYKLAV